MNRKQYASVALLMMVLIFGGGLLDQATAVDAPYFGMLAWVIAMITMTVCSWKRLADAGWWRWPALLFLIPGVGILVVLVLIFAPTRNLEQPTKINSL